MPLKANGWWMVHARKSKLHTTVSVQCYLYEKWGSFDPSTTEQGIIDVGNGLWLRAGWGASNMNLSLARRISCESAERRLAITVRWQKGCRAEYCKWFGVNERTEWRESGDWGMFFKRLKSFVWEMESEWLWKPLLCIYWIINDIHAN